jgi:hypothetical protein
MSDYDDEFKDVKKGLPSENTAQKSSIKFIVLFTIVGIIIAAIVLWLDEEDIEIFSQSGHILKQVLMTGILSLLMGSLQAWIFKSKIKSRLFIFIAFSALGGIVGGFIGGILRNSELNAPIIIGAINGFLAGGLSSLIQNKLMGNEKYGLRWFLYNSISWAAIFSIAWFIGWEPDNSINVAIAGAFFMITSGISLVVFLKRTPQIEFS